VTPHPVLAFSVIAIAFTWAFRIPLAVSGVPENAVGFVAFTTGAFGPAIAAAVVTWLRGDSVRAWAATIVSWRAPGRFWLVALVLPGLLAVIAGAVALAVWGGDLTLPTRYQVVAYPIQYVVIVLAGGGANEEPGWRGFALPHLQRRHSPVTASLVVAVPWFVWHLSTWWIPWTGQSTLPIPVFAVTIVALSIVPSWLYDVTDRRLLLVMAAHASVNAAPVLYLAGAPGT